MLNIDTIFLIVIIPKSIILLHMTIIQADIYICMYITLHKYSYIVYSLLFLNFKKPHKNNFHWWTKLRRKYLNYLNLDVLNVNLRILS